MSYYHVPVMLREVVQYLVRHQKGIYVDCTLGGGGHAYAILTETEPDGILIGIDVDDDAILASEERLERFSNRKRIIKGNFSNIESILKSMNIGEVDGILLDLGVSTHQLETAERGFSFTLNAKLDMRMDRTIGITAYEVINNYTEEEIARIIKTYGEEPMAKKIARAITMQRKFSPIKTTGEIADIVKKSLPCRIGQKIHPATKTFQALRIYINKELANLQKAINNGIEMLKVGGRIAIISFHSLEDKIVKNTFRTHEKGCVCPSDIPVCACYRKPKLKIITKKPVHPTEDEILINPRSRSAILRVAERI